MNLPRVIGIHAPARQSGKSTIADILVRDHGYQIAKFAGGIYSMFRGLAQFAGVQESVIIDATTGPLKEAPLAELGGLSFRRFAETVGTDWGRNMISKTLWVDIAESSLAHRLRAGEKLVVDDVRFPNEGDSIIALGGINIKVTRPTWNGGVAPTLASEGHMTDFVFHQEFLNDGSKEHLEGAVRQWLWLWTGSPVSSL